MTITYGELADRWGMSDEACEVLGVNPWSLSDGLASRADTIALNWEQARQLNISKSEFSERERR